MREPDLAPGHRLRPILIKAARDRGGLGVASGRAAPAHWDAEHFRLDRVARFRALDPAARARVLARCSDSRLVESYFIEKGGIYYAARMSTLAESTQERMLYALFAADEALHCQWIAEFVDVGALPDPAANPFLALLTEVSRDESRSAMAYVLQVVLEGWGLHHYRELADGCRTPGLREVFARIQRDEAKHHGAGLVIFGERGARPEELAVIIGWMRRFLGMVQVGPQAVAGALFAEAGIAAAELGERTRVFTELGAEAETQRKLDLIAACAAAAGHADEILGALRESGSLTARSAEDCARASQGF